jgi:hypothetical protein
MIDDSLLAYYAVSAFCVVMSLIQGDLHAVGISVTMVALVAAVEWWQRRRRPA